MKLILFALILACSAFAQQEYYTVEMSRETANLLGFPIDPRVTGTSVGVFIRQTGEDVYLVRATLENGEQRTCTAIKIEGAMTACWFERPSDARITKMEIATARLSREFVEARKIE